MTETEDSSELPELDLRVARILAARSHGNADRLLVLEVDIGGEVRQIVAGIVGHYDPGDLPGLNIVVVANLQAAVLRGEESQGMLLAAEDEAGQLGLLTAPDAEPGQRVSSDTSRPPAEEVSFAEFKQHDLRADDQGVTQNGEVLLGTRLVMDRHIFGRLH